MTAEYGLTEGQTIQQLARELLDAAGDDPSVVAWTHRPDTPGGGVFVVTSDEVAARVLQRRQLAAAVPAEDVQLDETEAEEETGDGSEDGAETPAEDGKPLTTAQKRRAAKEAKAAAEAEAAAAQTETPAEQPAAEQKSE